jgi:ABC-2 type transport system ATP-binding protein
MIRVTDLCYEYPGKRALNGISCSIAEGSITALVGPNGAGKTTLLRCIAGIDEPFSGRIETMGIDVAAEPRRVHRILGYLSDFFGLYDDLTVRQCLTFAAWLHLLPAEGVARQVEKTAGRLDLTEWLDKKVSVLSRGWRQRLGIAQAIIHEPRLLLLDEPASGLDPEARIALSSLFRRLQIEGMTLLVSSHILAELEDYCTDMLVLRDGKIIEHQQAARGDQTQALRITFARDAEKFMSLLASLPGVNGLERDGETVRLRVPGGEPEQQAILKQLIGQGASVKNFDSGPERLQDVYLSLGKGKTDHAS